MKLIVESHNKSEAANSLRDYLAKYDLGGMVSGKIGLGWRTDFIKIKHADSNGDWEGNDTVLVDFSRGIWCLSSIAHELVHLILRQNDWTRDAILNKFLNSHPELSVGNRGEGYLLEQIIAYLVQVEVERYIGQQESMASMINAWDKKRFEEIILKEYSSDFSKKLADKIIEEWVNKPKKEDVLSWLKKLISII